MDLIFLCICLLCSTLVSDPPLALQAMSEDCPWSQTFSHPKSHQTKRSPYYELGKYFPAVEFEFLLKERSDTVRQRVVRLDFKDKPNVGFVRKERRGRGGLPASETEEPEAKSAFFQSQQSA